jgi:hypothetical protein
MPVRCASSATTEYSSGACASLTSCALYMRSTILSEYQYVPTFITMAKMNAITMPL